MKKNVRNSLLIGIDQGHPDMVFFNASRRLVAIGYTRIVIGKRGPYVEFTRDQIQWHAFKVPHDQIFRWTDERAYYVEYRSFDESRTMLYFQKRTVGYADYKVGMCYIAPTDLLRAEMQPVMMA
jgi:hypothetical protein